VRAKPTLGAAALQDLMLQAEILVQYGMRTKAVESCRESRNVSAGRKRRNEDLQRLYLAAESNRNMPERRPCHPRPWLRPHRSWGHPRRCMANRPTSAALPGWRRLRANSYHQNNANTVLGRRPTRWGRSGK